MVPQLNQQHFGSGAHKSCLEHIEFLHEDLTDIIQKGQRVILSASDVKELSGLWVSLPGVVPQRERQPRWMCGYSWYGMNDETLPLISMKAV